MTLIRCPTHKIPYNDENPRGCPVCAQEKESGGQPTVMQELARVSQVIRMPDGADEATETQQPASEDAESGWSTAPRAETPPVDEGLLRRAFGAHRGLWLGAVVIVALGIVLLRTVGPRFVEQPHPAPLVSDLLPLPIEPNTSINAVFAMLGSQPPQTHPDASQLARYSYGSDLAVDVLNGTVYAITFSITNRSWSGLWIGLQERQAEGTLALLGVPQEADSPSMPTAQTINGYQVYGSLDERPRRTLKAEVRPPNGCYDVLADLRPKQIGLIIDGDRRFVAVAREGASPEWVVTRVRIVSRALGGPYVDGIVC